MPVRSGAVAVVPRRSRPASAGEGGQAGERGSSLLVALQGIAQEPGQRCSLRRGKSCDLLGWREELVLDGAERSPTRRCQRKHLDPPVSRPLTVKVGCKGLLSGQVKEYQTGFGVNRPTFGRSATRHICFDAPLGCIW